MGLAINVNKTKVMRVKTDERGQIILDGVVVKDVTKFTYLGSVLDRDGCVEKDVFSRLNKARSSFYNLRGVWKARNVSLVTKMKLFNAIVMSTLLYGSECWSLRVALQNKLGVFQRRCFRNILRIFRLNRVTNEELLRRTRKKDINVIIKERRLCWYGHVL